MKTASLIVLNLLCSLPCLSASGSMDHEERYEVERHLASLVRAEQQERQKELSEIRSAYNDLKELALEENPREEGGGYRNHPAFRNFKETLDRTQNPTDQDLAQLKTLFVRAMEERLKDNEHIDVLVDRIDTLHSGPSTPATSRGTKKEQEGCTIL